MDIEATSHIEQRSALEKRYTAVYVKSPRLQTVPITSARLWTARAAKMHDHKQSSYSGSNLGSESDYLHLTSAHEMLAVCVRYVESARLGKRQKPQRAPETRVNKACATETRARVTGKKKDRKEIQIAPLHKPYIDSPQKVYL